MSSTLPLAPRPGPSRGPTLPLQQAPAHPPPFALPGSHFLASLIWLCLGTAGLVIVAPTLARGAFLDPRVFAVVHAFTLGVVTTAIFGALYQMFPPLLGVTLRSVRVAAAGFGLLTSGILALVVGLWAAVPVLQAVGWLLITLAIGCVSWNLFPQRRKAPFGRITGRYISAGHSALGLALLLAGARIGEGLGWWQVDRLGVLSAHFHLAALGFATLTAVGVSTRILPMFLGAAPEPQWPLRWIGPLGGAGLLVFASGQIAHARVASLVGAALLVGSMALYLRLIAGYFFHRTRPLDPALGHIGSAYVGLAATVVAGVAVLVTDGAARQRGVAAYAILAVIGWLVLLVIGVYYRIIPFLSWLNLAGRGAAGQDPIGLMPRRAAWASLAILTSSIAMMVAAVWLGHGGWATAGAAGFAVGVGLLLAQYVRLLLVLATTRRAASGS